MEEYFVNIEILIILFYVISINFNCNLEQIMRTNQCGLFIRVAYP